MNIRQYMRLVNQTPVDKDVKSFINTVFVSFEKLGFHNIELHGTKIAIKKGSLYIILKNPKYLEDQALKYGIDKSKFTKNGSVSIYNNYDRISLSLSNHDENTRFNYFKNCTFPIVIRRSSGQIRTAKTFMYNEKLKFDDSQATRFEFNISDKKSIEKTIEKAIYFYFRDSLRVFSRVIKPELVFAGKGYFSEDVNIFLAKSENKYPQEFMNFIAPYVLSYLAYRMITGDGGILIKKMDFLHISAGLKKNYEGVNAYSMCSIHNKEFLSKENKIINKYYMEITNFGQKYFLTDIIKTVKRKRMKTIEAVKIFIHQYLRNCALEALGFTEKVSIKTIKNYDKKYYDMFFDYLTPEEKNEFSSRNTMRKFNI